MAEGSGVGLWMVAVFILGCVIFLLFNATVVKPALATTTTLQQVSEKSLLVKLNLRGNDTVCYNLPIMSVPHCVNGTKTYVEVPGSMACTTVHGIIYDMTPVVLMQYNDSNIWGPNLTIKYVNGSNQNSTEVFTPGFEVKDIECGVH